MLITGSNGSLLGDLVRVTPRSHAHTANCGRVARAVALARFCTNNSGRNENGTVPRETSLANPPPYSGKSKA